MAAVSSGRQGPASSAAPPDPLQRFCADLLATVGPAEAGPGDLFQGLREELVRALQEGARGVAAELRRELSGWGAAIEQLEQLGRSPYLPDAGAVHALRDHLAWAWDRAAHIADALEAVPGSDEPGTISGPVVYEVLSSNPSPLPPPRSGEGEKDSLDSSTRGEAARLGCSRSAPPLRLGEGDGGRGCQPSPQQADETLVTTAACEETAEAPALTRSDEAEACCRRGEDHARRGEFAPAIALYTEALRLDPCRSVTLRKRAQAQLLSGHIEQAVEDFTAALRADSTDLDALTGRGDALAALGTLGGAIEDYTRVLTLDPARVRTRFNRAVAYRLGKQYSLALKELDRVIDACPDYASAYFNRGLVLLAQGQAERAVVDFRRTTELAPHHKKAVEQLREAARVCLDAPPSPAPVAPPASTAPASPAPPSPERREAPPVTPTNRVEVRCPRCGESGSVRWDRLDRLLSCRRCSRWYRVHRSGTLVEVVPTPDGRWMEKRVRDAATRANTLRWFFLRVLPVCGVVLGVVVFWLVRRSASSEPEGPPRELKPRVERFVQAWLVGDVPAMRQLTVTTRERALYSWYRKNGPPRLADGAEDAAKYDDIHIEVSDVKGEENLSQVKVSIRGVAGAAGKVNIRLALLWEERGETWYFVPPLR
jgi:tetratricopeptide (TPR) repeat protein